MNRFAQHLLPVERATRVGRLVFLCAAVGVIAGLGSILFEVLVAGAEHLFLDASAGYRPAGAGGQQVLFSPSATPYRAWVLALLPAAGGLASGALVWWLAPEAAGPGTGAAIDAYHRRRGAVRRRVPWVKTLASAITLGTGGSAGREGPIAQIGAGFGSWFADGLGLSARERRILMVAGMAAGVGAIFRSPLAAALFAAEVLYKEMDLEFEVIVPSVISSIVAYSVFTLAFGTQHLFVAPDFAFDDPRHLVTYSGLTLAVAAGARVYVGSVHGAQRLFARLRAPKILQPALGGVGVGLFAFFLPEALASGYGLVQSALTHQLGTGLLLAVVLGKIVTTSLTVGSGQAGGVFGPAVVIGGLLGAAVGQLCNTFVPGWSPPPGAFVMVGMAGFFAAAANTPVSTIIMVSEMTGNYNLLVPTMWVCILAFLLVRRSTLYSNQLARRTDSPVHLGEMMQDVLRSLSVQDALGAADHEPMVCVRANATVSELSARFAETHHACFAVVDGQGELLGVLDEEALRQALTDPELREVVVAADLIDRAPLVIPTESLHSAMRKMVQSRREELVVVADDDERRPVGTLSRRDLIGTYDHRVQVTVEEEDAASSGWKIPIVSRIARADRAARAAAGEEEPR